MQRNTRFTCVQCNYAFYLVVNGTRINVLMNITSQPERIATEHVLQRCNRHQSERIAQWPSATPLHQNLYGGLEDLKKTTNFVIAAGLVV